MPIEEILLSAAITGLSVFLSSYVMFRIAWKKGKNDLKTEILAFKPIIEAWLNSETGQKALYTLGALIAQGAKDSLPFISKGGKLKWQDLLLQIGLNWAKGKGIIPDLTQQQQTEQQTTEGKW